MTKAKHKWKFININTSANELNWVYVIAFSHHLVFCFFSDNKCGRCTHVDHWLSFELCVRRRRSWLLRCFAFYFNNKFRFIYILELISKFSVWMHMNGFISCWFSEINSSEFQVHQFHAMQIEIILSKSDGIYVIACNGLIYVIVIDFYQR